MIIHHPTYSNEQNICNGAIKTGRTKNCICSYIFNYTLYSSYYLYHYWLSAAQLRDISAVLQYCYFVSQTFIFILFLLLFVFKHIFELIILIDSFTTRHQSFLFGWLSRNLMQTAASVLHKGAAGGASEGPSFEQTCLTQTSVRSAFWG